MPLGDFSAQAEAYCRSRPGYPAELLDRLVAGSGARPGDRVADLGAGTGICSRELADRGLLVTAVEPGREMRRRAIVHAGITWQDGTFEASQLPSHSQRWIVAAQSFHWADPERALPEMRRVLESGACFTVLWNNRENERSPIVAWTRGAMQRHVPEFDGAYRDTDWASVLTSTRDFDGVTYEEARHVVCMSRERYLNLWRSHNRFNSLAGPERGARFFAELEAYLEGRRVAEVEVPYLCRSWTVRSRP